MTRLVCTLRPHSGADHLQMLFTGYHLLARRGIVAVRQAPARDPASSRRAPHGPRPAHLRVELSDGFRLHYDTRDSGDVDEAFLGDADLYFKRSYDPARAAELGEEGRKLRPLGLSSKTWPDEVDLLALDRIARLGAVRYKVGELLRTFPLFDALRYTARVGRLQGTPDPDAPPRVLFMTRVWPPAEHAGVAGADDADRQSISETRVACVRALRDTFGDRFSGGVARSAYALATYPDAVLPSREASKRGAYLDRVAEHPICVATTGLHGSIGNKLGEYVAFSRAIVSEELRYEVPGGFADGRNYLSFTTPDECVRAVARLMEDRDLRARMMVENARYFFTWSRPDALVLQSLLVALGQGATG